MTKDYDLLVIGAGIVGLSTAWQYQQRFPSHRVAVIDKELRVAAHQTGRNSGVIHAGVYYAPGSLKADFCRRGLEATYAFCREHNLPCEQRGKLIVASDETELSRMEDLFARCLSNGIEVERVDASTLQRREPNITGVGALFVAATGIVDYSAICRQLAEMLQAGGADLLLGHELTGILEGRDGVALSVICDARQFDIRAQQFVACAGLQADRLVDMHGLERRFAIVPFRGEYYRVKTEKTDWVRHLIYPVPDPDLPFLGVHLTPMIDGSLTVGPNAVLGWKREGYGRFNFNFRDSLETFRFDGFQSLLRQHLQSGMGELRDSLSKRGYCRRVRKYCPDIRPRDLGPWPTGVRAQAVSDEGELIHDFLFADSPRGLHVCNAPSPAATSAFPIGEYLLQRLTHK